MNPPDEENELRDGNVGPPAPARGRAGLVALLLVTALALGAALLAVLPQHLIDRALAPVAGALGPLAVMPDPAIDDTAGDALTPAADADAASPTNDNLIDDRIAAALGPLTGLACRKDDFSADTIDPVVSDRRQRSRALNAPLDPTAATDEILTSGPLLSAAAGPIALWPSAQLEDGPSNAVATTGAGTSLECPQLLQHTFNRLQTGESQSLCQFNGKVLLVVNTASYCMYTRQYEGLEAIYRKYRSRGLVVIGFPTNDFNQEPGSNGEIAEFCRTTYGVQFPMYEKTSIGRIAANPLFADLTAATGKAPTWNFHKYVVDRHGKPVASFGSAITPTDRELTDLIERLLAEPVASTKG
jgi:glutathione peroxidase